MPMPTIKRRSPMAGLVEINSLSRICVALYKSSEGVSLAPLLGIHLSLQLRKGIECGGRCYVSCVAAICHIFQFRVLVLMAISAEKFPIAAIRWIVIVVAVFVVNFQQLKIAIRKGTSAASAHPWKKLEGLRSVSRHTLLCVASSFKNHLIQPGFHLHNPTKYFAKNLANAIASASSILTFLLNSEITCLRASTGAALSPIEAILRRTHTQARSRRVGHVS